MFFITIEGGEYAGKTTQAQLLVDSLNAKGVKAMFLRAPGGTEICEGMRSMLKGQFSKTETLESSTEILLYLASTTQLDHKVLKPALKEGIVCVMDRWIDTTMVYQTMFKKSISHELLGMIQKEIMNVTIPNLTFILDVPIDEVMKRKALRDSNAITDHYDNGSEEFFTFVRDAYLKLGNPFTNKNKFNRYTIIDGNRSVEDIHRDILNCSHYSYVPLQVCGV